MKANTISTLIKKKVKLFAGSIDHAGLRECVLKDALVTGGCIASMFLKEAVNDYDLYFMDKKTVFKLMNYYICNNNLTNVDIRMGVEDSVLVHDSGYPYKHFIPKLDYLDWDDEALEFLLKGCTRLENFVLSSGCVSIPAVEREVESFDLRFISSNAITLSGQIQLINRFIGNEDTIHNTFDFVHTTNYWTMEKGLVTNKEALEAILARDLVYRGSMYPLASIFRTRKFIQRGWGIHVANFVRMAMQLNKLNLYDVDVLEDQLTGVDAAYLKGFIAAIRDQMKKDVNFVLDYSYVEKLCEEMSNLEERGDGDV